jgi:hypothetical protein
MGSAACSSRDSTTFAERTIDACNHTRNNFSVFCVRITKVCRGVVREHEVVVRAIGLETVVTAMSREQRGAMFTVCNSSEGSSRMVNPTHSLADDCRPLGRSRSLAAPAIRSSPRGLIMRGSASWVGTRGAALRSIPGQCVSGTRAER